MNKAKAQEKDPKRQGLADGQMDRLMDPRTDETKLISRIWTCNPRSKQCPYEQTSLKLKALPHKTGAPHHGLLL